jgi:dTDP-4-dehydrorhamnose 3,5-epimerase
MKFIETKLKGAFLIDPDFLEDERGFFARSCCRKEFEQHRLNSDWVQCSISYNKRKGTLRGMHYQVAPYAEEKLVRCTMGAIFDVIIDLRPDSKTNSHWIAAELSAQNRKMIYVPQGFAHGFQTLADNSEVYRFCCQRHADVPAGVGIIPDLSQHNGKWCQGNFK